MQEENRVTEIEEIDSSKEESFEEEKISEEEIEKKKRRDLKFELVLFFILGILVGITIKTEAVKKITIGFNDYQLKNGRQAYDVEKIKADIIQQQKQAQQAAQESAGGAPDIQGLESNSTNN
jgi:hypothetical protein